MFSIVYNPVLNQLWTAKKGHGAEYNGSKVRRERNILFVMQRNILHQIHVSSCTQLDQALLIQEMGASSPEKSAMVVKNLENFIPKVRSIRAYGSAGINLAYLAMGAIDAYFEFGFHIWDYAGPLLLVREAGGVGLDTEGGEVDYLARRVLACSTRDLADQILPHITSIQLERDG